MDAPPSLGQRKGAAAAAAAAAASASSTAGAIGGAGAAGTAPSAWGTTSTSQSWLGPQQPDSDSNGKVSTGKALRRLLLRSGIGGRRRARLMAAVAMCFLAFSVLVLCVYRASHGQRQAVVSDIGGKPLQRSSLPQQQQPPPALQEPKSAAAAGEPDSKPKSEAATGGAAEPFPLAKRAFIAAEQLAADPTVTMPVRLPLGGRVVTDEATGQRDVLLSLCSLDLAPYHRHPAMYPKAKHLAQALCEKAGGRKEQLSARALAADAAAGRQLQPSGFVFHESRVGSTLVANMLASVPTNLVYSEPHLPISVVNECARLGCSEAETVELLRLAVLAMGRSRHHGELFIKFQSNMGPHMRLVLQAFPDTPWIFIYRNPVEVMVSNLDKGNGGACIRHKERASPAVQALLGVGDGAAAAQVGDEEFCAAHVAALCDTALTHLRAEGSKGHVIGYDGLAEALLEAVLPGHLGLVLSEAERARMAATAAIYSKAQQDADKGDGKALFQGDAEKKRAAASDAVKLAVAKHLDARTQALAGLEAEARPGVAAMARLRTAQEGILYERTGSRAFGPPTCPDEPAYPAAYRVVDMVANWNPDDMALPPRHYHGLCRFDYGDEADRAKAARYAEAEVPFILHNLPALDAAVAKWNAPGYLEEKLGEADFRVEVSDTNRFLYYSLGRSSPEELEARGYTPPTHLERWPYRRWLDAVANRLAAVRSAAAAATTAGDANEEKSGEEATRAAEVAARRAQEHYYFRVSSPDAPLVDKDLTVFGADAPRFFRHQAEQPPKANGAVHCRLGMEGIVAAAHYDGHRNFVAALGGTRRWILGAPGECAHAYLRPNGDPSARHSQVEWAAPDLEAHPEFAHMRGTEVLLTPGDVLFVPSFWLHYIVNLGQTAQCNSRFGRDLRGLEEVQRCGFHVGKSVEQMKSS